MNNNNHILLFRILIMTRTHSYIGFMYRVLSTTCSTVRNSYSFSDLEILQIKNSCTVNECHTLSFLHCISQAK